MNFLSYLIIAATTVFASFVQSNMAFGGSVILINILPVFLPYSKAITIMQCVLVAYNAYFSIVYWKKISWKVMVPALVPGTLLAVFFTFISTKTTVGIMNFAVGIIFIFLSVYNLFLSEKFHVGRGKCVGFAMGTMSGFTNAFFGFAGPPIAAYFTSSIDDKISYFATSQFFFLCSSIACIGVRLFSGAMIVSDIPILLFIMLFFAIGAYLGLNVMKKMNGRVLKKTIYSFIGFNGLYIIIREFFLK